MSHTHGPGESHSHSHGPPPQGPPGPQGPQRTPQPQQQQIQVRMDPAAQALIDQQFTEVPISIVTDPLPMVFCPAHKLEKCTDCNVDFVLLNRLSRLLAQNPNVKCPPPPNMTNTKPLTQAVTNMKEEGNQFYKMGLHNQAISRYNMAANVAIQRPPFETPATMREELSVVLSNRAAAHIGAQDYISALADAETVIQIRRNWPKGHIRRAKALIGLKSYIEAIEAAHIGLSYDPENSELKASLGEAEKLLETSRLAIEKVEGVDEPPQLVEV